MSDRGHLTNSTFGNAVITHENAEQQAQILAADIAKQLNAAVAARGHASVAFSGGSTPKAMLSALAIQAVDWSKVHVTLVDERCVSPQSNRSNARLLSEQLFSKLTGSVNFYPLYQENETLKQCMQRFEQFPLPFDVVHLGMGEDAHTASFFPDADNLHDMLDCNQNQNQSIASTVSASSGEPRLTWNLASLLSSRYIVVQLLGQKKWQVMSHVLEILRGTTPIDTAKKQQYPILAVLEKSAIKDATGTPLKVYYAGS